MRKRVARRESIPITDGDERVERIEGDVVGFAVFGSMCKFGTYCFGFSLAFVKNIAQMFRYRRAVDAERLDRRLLR